MNSLYNYLPKDLVSIVEEYSKDRTHYDRVIKDLELNILVALSEFDWNNVNLCNSQDFNCVCDDVFSFSELLEIAPECFDSHFEFLNNLLITSNKFITTLLNVII